MNDGDVAINFSNFQLSDPSILQITGIGSSVLVQPGEALKFEVDILLFIDYSNKTKIDRKHHPFNLYTITEEMYTSNRYPANSLLGKASQYRTAHRGGMTKGYCPYY